MENSFLALTGRDQSDAVVGRSNSADGNHRPGGGRLEAPSRCQSSSSAGGTREIFQDRRDGGIKRTGETAGGVDAVPAAADSDAPPWFDLGRTHHECRRQFELHLYIAHPRPYFDPIADRPEIEAQRRLAYELPE